MRSRRALAVGLALLAGVAGLVAWRVVEGRPARLCAALDARVPGIDSVDWDNGVTSTAATWAAVLTDGVEHAAPARREDLAAAVAADQAGWERLHDRLPAESREVAARLRAIVVSPAASDAGPDAAADVLHLRRLATDRCGGLY